VIDGVTSEALVRAALRDFVVARARRPAPETLVDSDNMFDVGLLSSVNVLEIVQFINTRWGVRVSARDVFEGRLATIDGMVSLVLGSRP
jgi:hypothetical protein